MYGEVSQSLKNSIQYSPAESVASEARDKSKGAVYIVIPDFTIYYAVFNFMYP
jgi:hypothetical protein